MFAEIIVDIENNEVDRIFDYRIKEEDHPKIGSRVVVPFGNRSLQGFVLNLKESSDYPIEKIKYVTKILDTEPLILPEMLKLKDFLIKNYNLRNIDCLNLFLPSGLMSNKVKPKMVSYVTLNSEIDLENYKNNIRKNAVKQLEAVNFFEINKTLDMVTANKNFTLSVIKKLINENILLVSEQRQNRKILDSNREDVVHKLTSEQKVAINKIMSGSNSTFLLHGVTGSGKTEVYMNLIDKVLKQGKTAIMLVPEIGLTPQVVENFVSRFGNTVAVLHSGLSVGERFDEWFRIYSGEVKIAVGARSAIFAPLKNVGIIIIDEEHDSSYFSESNPRYSTHEIASFRANYNGCNLVLGSATPSIDSYTKALKGEYNLIEMPTRANGFDLPQIQIVDMRKEVMNGNTTLFSQELLCELDRTIQKGEQAIIFLNRRGYTSFLMCKDCGYVAKCENCDVSLVYHKEDDQLKCHYCGNRYHNLSCCPQCGSKFMKQGNTGTQKIVEELHEYFPNVKVFRMDNDTTTTKDSHEKLLRDFANTKPSILVGTQMIAKGHDFPLVTFVGILDADQSLHFNDFRATERTFQLITQVAGRAGRSKIKGKVILQTLTPKHYVYKFASNYEYKKFYDKENNMRQITNFPPYAKIVRILVTSEDEEKSSEQTQVLYEEVCNLKARKGGFIYLQAMKSPIKRIKQKFRYQILMRLELKMYDEIIQDIFKIVKNNDKKNVSTFVEINPQNLS